VSVQLRGTTWAHARGFDPLVATAEAYGKQHNVEITWEKRSLFAFGVQPLHELVETYDLIILDHPHIGEAARHGYLVPLDELAPEARITELAEHSIGPSHESYVYDGHLWALAVDAAAQVSAYRSDLLDHPPATWREVVTLAKRGVVLWPLKAADAISSFYTLAANRGTPCAQTPDMFISSFDGLAVLEAIDAVRRHVPAMCLDMDPIAVLDVLSTDDSYFYSPLLFGYSNYSRDGFRPKLVAFTDIPATGSLGHSGSLLGGAGLAVSSRSQHVALAADYSFWVASPETQMSLYVESGGQPGNADAWHDERANLLTHGYFASTYETLERSYLRPRYAGYPHFQDRFMALLHDHLVTGSDPRALIRELNEEYRSSRRAAVPSAASTEGKR
jgi:multiple sugar transport system substrate-binding protein